MRRLDSRSRLSCSQRTRSAGGDQPTKKCSRAAKQMEKPEITIGLDLGDRFSHYCMLNEDGDAIETGRIQTTEETLRRYFDGEPPMRVALECGTHSPLAVAPRLVECRQKSRFVLAEVLGKVDERASLGVFSPARPSRGVSMTNHTEELTSQRSTVGDLRRPTAQFFKIRPRVFRLLQQ